jgi:hypothetical protein
MTSNRIDLSLLIALSYYGARNAPAAKYRGYTAMPLLLPSYHAFLPAGLRIAQTGTKERSLDSFRGKGKTLQTLQQGS